MNNNSLNITGFGDFGINTGNFIYQSLHQSDTKYYAVFDGAKRTITVLNSSDLSPENLNKMVYSKEVGSKYRGWYPEITGVRDRNKNLVIKLSMLRPRNAIYHPPLSAVKPYTYHHKNSSENQAHPETKTESGVVEINANFSPEKFDKADFKKTFFSFLEVSTFLTKKIEDVLLKPEDFFSFPPSSKPKFISIPIEVSPTNIPKKDNSKALLLLNFVMIPKKHINSIHHELTILTPSLIGKPFGIGKLSTAFGITKNKITNHETYIISFPNNELFNVLLERIHSVFTSGIGSTYKAIGEVSAATHVDNWIHHHSWPYDGDANDMNRLKSCLHDAHHIIFSLHNNHLLSNIKLFLRRKLQNVSKEILLENETASSISGALECLHNYAHDHIENHFSIHNDKLYFYKNSMYNGLVKSSDFPVNLEESLEDYRNRKRCYRELDTQISK